MNELENKIKSRDIIIEHLEKALAKASKELKEISGSCPYYMYGVDVDCIKDCDCNDKKCEICWEEWLLHE